MAAKKDTPKGVFFGDPPETRLHCAPGMGHSKCADAVEPASGNTPPGCCIYIFESPAVQKKDTPKGVFFGDPPETRTPDPLLKRQLLYRLS